MQLSQNKQPESLSRWWVGQGLPDPHIFLTSQRKPKNIISRIRVYIRTWVIHPIKRRIAKYYLIFLRRFFSITVIVITGSAGKTTTKEMIASILKRKGKTVSSFENIDPIYNIPSTILKCTPKTHYLVLEMGVEFPGEMDFYLWLAKPDVGVLTNIYPTHTQFFNDVEGVYKEKSKLIKSLPAYGYAILNSESKYLNKLKKNTKVKVITYGSNGLIKARDRSITKDLNTEFTLAIGKSKSNVRLPILGGQFVSNALAAAATTYALGFSLEDIKKGLESYTKPKHRMEIIKLKNSAIVLDDSYNNNPEAAKETLKVFEEIAGKRKRIVVFGDMLELGALEKRYHMELGKIIANYKVDYLVCVGNASKLTFEEAKKKLGDVRVKWVKSASKVNIFLKPLITKNSFILIKGSRSIGLDQLVSEL